MRLVVPPGVFRPHSDSRLLARRIHAELRPGADVADICTGSGLLAITAAQAGARSVTAVDVSRRAVLTASLNARLNGVRIRSRRGDLFGPLGGRRFDLIVSNPPYVPAATDRLPTRGPARAWDAGRDGRALLDRICAGADEHLRPGGTLLLVHSEVCDPGRTLDVLGSHGLEGEVIERARGPLGPLLSERAHGLTQRGLLRDGAQTEEVVIIRGRLPAAAPSSRRRGAPAGTPAA